ncbi:hypothetical protein F5B22DRAFT_269062 [Xylaria bambusicola]|uniref:uncharacterized protein n=1 Tax=Xylaria bambusicola TaxID=326684 RepID=UPI0020085E6C|nr:uncharacterized protein F5B22DRAFT_269062 [Xylaria bambusicola]KAI0526111.1 hypothetical protein F5B22DRAFT_269062 [Xylaria bambusicola]
MASSYRCYPFLTQEEFAEVCHYFDAKYCRTTLGPLRSQWQLRLRTALDTSPNSDTGVVTFIQITKPLESRRNNEVDNELASRLGNFALNEPPLLDTDQSMADSMLMNEELDTEVVRYPSKLNPSRGNGIVEYEIHLHPTYQAPCLWFSLHNLPFDESPLDIDSVFRHLVPDEFIHRIGHNPIGGISIDHHPVTGVPTFFVHPCNLGDVMATFDCSKEDYLTVWLGIAGSCVGLGVPKELAIGLSVNPAPQLLRT